MIYAELNNQLSVIEFQKTDAYRSLDGELVDAAIYRLRAWSHLLCDGSALFV